MRMSPAILIAVALGGGVARAQQPAAPGMSLAEAAARRFPQPVSVGMLLGERVLQPLESQPTLGFVDRVVRSADGQVKVVVRYGGILGFFARPIAVPVDAMVLLGPYMEIVDFKPQQLRAFPTFDDAAATVLAAGDVIQVGLARPSH